MDKMNRIWRSSTGGPHFLSEAERQDRAQLCQRFGLPPFVGSEEILGAMMKDHQAKTIPAPTPRVDTRIKVKEIPRLRRFVEAFKNYSQVDSDDSDLACKVEKWLRRRNLTRSTVSICAALEATRGHTWAGVNSGTLRSNVYGRHDSRRKR